MKELLRNKKVIMTISAIALILAVVAFVRRRKKSEEAHASVAGGGSSSGTSSQMPEASFPLTPYSMAGEYSATKGSYGRQIALLQRVCNDRFGKELTVDGKFGPRSESAFLECFGYIFNMPYSQKVYNGFMVQYGGVGIAL